MKKSYTELKQELKKNKKRWLITGVSGFIGSNLLETLLQLNQKVTGIDNFLTGYHYNLEEVRNSVSSQQWQNFTFIEGDIRDPETCRRACQANDYILHQAALGSVPWSIEDPNTTYNINVLGFLNILNAARETSPDNIVYASSSAVYGDNEDTKKIEGSEGRPLSPYAASKITNEKYAQAYASSYGLNSIGLRYFNIYGPRQNPEGPYAAVIPKWIDAFLQEKKIEIYGDGKNTRDFCHIDNVVQANLLAALAPKNALNSVYNVATGATQSLNKLASTLSKKVEEKFPNIKITKPQKQPFRDGDIVHSSACTDKIKSALNYQPTLTFTKGIEQTIDWYTSNH